MFLQLSESKMSVNFLMRKLSEKVESLFRLLHSKSDWEEHLLCWVCLFCFVFWPVIFSCSSNSIPVSKIHLCLGRKGTKKKKKKKKKKIAKMVFF